MSAPYTNRTWSPEPALVIKISEVSDLQREIIREEIRRPFMMAERKRKKKSRLQRLFSR